MKRTDLHAHSNHSDGLMHPAVVVTLAARAGLHRLALTDHDTTAGLAEAREAGAREGLEIVPGIELSVYDHEAGRKVHLLGYFIAADSPGLRRLGELLRERRLRAAEESLERLRRAGYALEREQVLRYPAPGGIIYKQHMLAALYAAGYGEGDRPGLKRALFHEGRDGEAPGLAHVSIDYPPVLEGLAAIREAGGLAVLAHPGVYDNFCLVPLLAREGLAGIETHHPGHSPAQRQVCLELARAHGLAVTGGSDFHGELDDERHFIGTITIGGEYDDLARRRAQVPCA